MTTGVGRIVSRRFVPFSLSLSLLDQSQQFPCELELDNDAERFVRSLFSMVFRALPRALTRETRTRPALDSRLARSLAAALA